jgi:hypothetical protein
VYGAGAEPDGKKLTRQTIKVGPVRWRRCVTVILNPAGLYLQVGRSNGILALRRHPPVFIPWAHLKTPRPGWLYLGQEAVQLSVGFPEIATITFPTGLYREMTAYLHQSS